jgi:hypothetical protein
MVAAFTKIDATRVAQLQQISERKKEALAKLDKQFATNKQVKGPLTIVVIVVVCVLAFIVIFLDSFRLFKYFRAIFSNRRKIQNKINPIKSENFEPLSINFQNENSSNDDYKDLEYNLYVSFLVAKHNGNLRPKSFKQNE